MARKKAKKTAIAIRKGGSGKTTTAINLAAGLHKRGYKVLLVDLDDQSNSTMGVGINPFALDKSIATLLTDIHAKTQDTIRHTESGLSILPATPELEQVGAGMNATSMNSLRLILEEIEEDYDYIIIDTQPGHSYLSLSALVAADYVLIPLQAHYLAMEGLTRIMKDISDVQNGDAPESRRGPNPNLSILGILPVMVQVKTNASQLIIEKVTESYPKLVLPLEIRLSIDFVNASIESKPLVFSRPNHPGAQSYLALADLVIAKLEAPHGKA